MLKPSSPESPKKVKAWWQPAVELFLRFSGWIVFPVLAALFLGRWLDDRFNSEPWIFMFCVGTAFVVSMVGLVKSARQEFERIDGLGESNPQRVKDKNYLKKYNEYDESINRDNC